MAQQEQRLDLDRLREVVRAVAGDEGLDLVVLFGSSIRGESSPQDLDLAVRASRPLDLTHLTNRLCVALGRSDVDLIDLRRSDPLVLRIVAEEGVLLHEAEAGAFTRFASLAARRFFDTRKFREVERLQIHDFLERVEAPE
jgi:predicted nucleotidyltransferase